MRRIVILLAVGIIALSAMCADSPVASVPKPNATTNAPPDETKSTECGDPVGVFTGSAYETAGEATGSDMVATVNYHRYAKQSSAELIAEGAIS